MQIAVPPAPAVDPSAGLGGGAPWVEFRERLRAFVARRVSRPADVDDIVQWTFLQMQRRLSGITDGERIHAWLYTTARRAVIDYYRSGSRRHEVLSGSALDLDAVHNAQGAGSGDSGQARQEVAACLAPLVGRLAPPDREAIEMTEIQGLRLADAAGRAGLSLSGMKSRVQRARSRLRRAMLDCCHVALDGRGTPISCAKREAANGPCCRSPDQEGE